MAATITTAKITTPNASSTGHLREASGPAPEIVLDVTSRETIPHVAPSATKDLRPPPPGRLPGAMGDRAGHRARHRDRDRGGRACAHTTLNIRLVAQDPG